MVIVKYVIYVNIFNIIDEFGYYFLLYLGRYWLELL